MKRFLLVDDHDLFRQVLTVVLEVHIDLEESIQARSLEQARRFLGHMNGDADLAIVDLDLPEGDATELIKNLRELDVTVLAYTTDQSLERRATALRVGAGEVLSTATPGEKIIDTAKRLIGE